MGLVNYEQLKQHYESVKPIRGTNIKPFMQRRRKFEHMVMQKNGDIQLICYNTPVFTVHPDSSFSVCHGGWVTRTTSCFIDHVCRMMSWREPLAYAFKYQNQLWLTQWMDGRAVRVEGREDHWHRMPITKEPIRYTYDTETRLYQPESNPVTTKKRKRVDRDKWKQVQQQQCKEFLTWFDAFGKLLDGVEVQDTWTLDYKVRACLMNPSILSRPNHWATKQAKSVLTAIFTGSDDEGYFQVVRSIADPSDGAVFHYKKQKTQVHNILKYLFDVYYHVDVEVEYALDRKTKW